MPNIWKEWRSFTETVDETTSAIRGVLVVIGMVAGIKNHIWTVEEIVQIG